MGVTDVPQWLPAAFIRSVLAAGATAPREEIEATCRRLLERWAGPDRRFHNVKHLIDVLARVDELAEETHDPDLVRLAAWYHGAVFSSTATKAYSRSGGEDEVASADLATEELLALGVPERTVGRIAELIVNLKRHEAAVRDIDCLALCDADLATLAADPQRYSAYRRAVREEYAHLPVRHYVEARRSIVSKLLARRHLFLSPMGAQWEDRARENLTAELNRLDAELATLGEAMPEESVTAAEAAQGEVFDESQPIRRDGASHVFTASHGTAERTAGPYDAPTERHAAERHDAPAPPADAPAATVAAAAAVTAAAAAAGAPGSRAADSADSRARVRASSLESFPDDLDGRRDGAANTNRAGRELIARTSRERIEEAVRHGAERAERDRRQRERLASARAAREAAQPARTERGADRGAQPLDPSGALLTAATPAEAAADAPPAVATPVEQRSAVDRVPEEIEPDPVTGELERPDLTPHSGIEREPELFGHRRDWRKDRHRR
ncbi:HD domain-containing protein [Georgenia muralis]|uniref:Putative metal-dependent HD superfamily phosphohydrolase n=1 Tax=Georgenia muralis TaxID=154117 RepID=A0A3N4Z446_9MICO|nr:putative metal-dependent HD superfamily phosphohydrolase [Georgenia muralis]